MSVPAGPSCDLFTFYAQKTVSRPKLSGNGDIKAVDSRDLLSYIGNRTNGVAAMLSNGVVAMTKEIAKWHWYPELICQTVSEQCAEIFLLECAWVWKLLPDANKDRYLSSVTHPYAEC